VTCNNAAGSVAVTPTKSIMQSDLRRFSELSVGSFFVRPLYYQNAFRAHADPESPFMIENRGDGSMNGGELISHLLNAEDSSSKIEAVFKNVKRSVIRESTSFYIKIDDKHALYYETDTLLNGEYSVPLTENPGVTLVKIRPTDSVHDFVPAIVIGLSRGE
jgi:hypothetical protein